MLEFFCDVMAEDRYHLDGYAACLRAVCISSGTKLTTKSYRTMTNAWFLSSLRTLIVSCQL